ncbi:MAG: bifunctional 5,10-methylene-tetrahydrofolate dehydrogenase/5,10-methylene-tetrahydrofolate cyclohydrolase, partial [Desulfobulbaceae bacterium]|nr:bifunctional 5,10-methylene-tetrahydrofolate dehydrogenase/5,10-methylene-tetrahydrofolate cyclohydrolase [Desulfobulbaceae bacterium]
MTAKIISGVETAKAIREELKVEVTELKEKHDIVPGLVTILVGEDPASQSYVSAKNKTAHALGIHSEQNT